MTANPHNLPKTVVHASGEVRVARTAVDYVNLLGRGFADKKAKPADVKPPAAK